MSAAALPEASASIRAPAPMQPVRFDVRDLDPDGDPRIDLDAFVNARWRAQNPVPADRSCWDTFAVLSERTLAIEAAIAEAAAASDARTGTAERIVGDFWTSGMRAAPDDALLCARARAHRTPRFACMRSRRTSAIGMRAGSASCSVSTSSPISTLRTRRSRTSARTASDCPIATTTSMRRRTASRGAARISRTSLRRSSLPAARRVARRRRARVRNSSSPPLRLRAASLLATSPRGIGRSTSKPPIAPTPHFPWSAFFRALGIAPPARFSLAMPAFSRGVRCAPRGDARRGLARVSRIPHRSTRPRRFSAASSQQRITISIAATLRGQTRR